MQRRILISFDGTLTAITEDLHGACMQAAATLFREDGDGADILRRFGQTQGTFALLEEIDAAPTNVLTLAHAADSTGVSSLTMAVHDLDTDRTRARLVSRTDIIQDIDPAYLIFSAVDNILRDPASKEKAIDRMIWAFEYVASTFGGHHKHADQAAVLADIRAVQETFGPRHGHPFRIVPDAVEGEDPDAVLDALAGAAAMRVEEIIAKAERRRLERAETSSLEAPR